MTRLLSIALLAATLSAQDIPQRLEFKDVRCFNCNQWNHYDGNGALEAFYQQPKHRWYASKRFWVPAVIFIGSGVATGFLATRASHPPIGRPIMPAMPAPVTPVFGGVTFIGIGGPGVPVVTSKGGAN